MTSQTLSETIIGLINQHQGISDRQLTDLIFGHLTHPSQINQTCRLLDGQGKISRRDTHEGVRNFPAATRTATSTPKPAIKTDHFGNEISEYEVKRHLQTWLEADGWAAQIAWGKTRGIDVVASRKDDLWLIEAKGCGSLPAMRVNYFLAMLGELLQRMDNGDARYSIALPNMKQFRGLWTRLPHLAKTRTHITALFVSADGTVEHLH